MVSIGDSKTQARYWYNGHYNAYEDAAEVLFKQLGGDQQQQPQQPVVTSSPTLAFGADSSSSSAVQQYATVGYVKGYGG